MGEREIRIEYSYTEAEYLAASRLYFFSSPSVLTRLAIVLILLMGSALFLTLLVGEFPLWSTFILVLIVEAAVLYNILVILPRRYFRGDGKFRDRYQVTFSDEGIAVKTSQIDSKLAWSLYTRVVEGASQYLLIYGNETRMMTMVPKRAFQNRMQEDAFRELLARHISDHTTLGRIKTRTDIESSYQPSSLNPPDWR